MSRRIDMLRDFDFDGDRKSYRKELAALLLGFLKKLEIMPLICQVVTMVYMFISNH